MAGKRQHYLPRFLQKGFSSRQSGKEVYTWVFKKDVEPYETNIINVGSEKFFYGDPAESSVDEDITEKEAEFFPILDELRRYSADTIIENKHISDLIIHLITRTRHLRLSLEEMGKVLLEIFHRYLSNPKDLNDLILRYIKANPHELVKSIEKGFEEQGIRKVDPKVIRRAKKWALKNASQLMASPAFHALRLSYIHAFSRLERDMPMLVRKSHLRALSEELVPPAMLSKIYNLKWMISVKPQGSFILGDIGPLVAKSKSGDFKALFLLEDDKVNHIYLPISDRHVIIGGKDVVADPCNVAMINIASASCSREFFIGREVTSTFLGYKEHIGTQSALFTAAELREMEADLLGGVFGSVDK
jgi:Protein of unknown function (DUF4238)